MESALVGLVGHVAHVQAAIAGAALIDIEGEGQQAGSLVGEIHRVGGTIDRRRGIAVEIEGTAARGGDVRVGGGGAGLVTAPAHRVSRRAGTLVVEVLRIGECGDNAAFGLEGGLHPGAAVRGVADGSHIHIIQGARQQVVERDGGCSRSILGRFLIGVGNGA